MATWAPPVDLAVHHEWPTRFERCFDGSGCSLAIQAVNGRDGGGRTGPDDDGTVENNRRREHRPRSGRQLAKVQLDTGTMDSLFEAGEFVRTVERAQGLPIAVLEEIVYENGWIGRGQLLEAAERYGKSNYGRHLRDVADRRIIVDPDDWNSVDDDIA